jgi:GNAT superfamily N-acetyltransferase
MIRAFDDGDLDAAAELLAERQRGHREREALLPGELDYRAEVEALWRCEGAVGAVADGAYLLATRQDDEWWGANAWVEAGGHAARDPEVVRDLYAFVAADLVATGRKAHYAWIPAGDDGLRDAWFRLGFGAQQALGAIEIPERPWPEGVREATEADLDALVAIEPVLQEHQGLSPVFSRVGPRSEEASREDMLEEIADPRIANLVAEADGRIVGNFSVVPIELSSTHGGVARVPGAALIPFAVTLPEARGTGAGVRLTDACFAWARAHGHETMVADWRVTNLLASRFWPGRGFRTTFLRLHRLIA